MHGCYGNRLGRNTFCHISPILAPMGVKLFSHLTMATEPLKHSTLVLILHNCTCFYQRNIWRQFWIKSDNFQILDQKWSRNWQRSMNFLIFVNNPKTMHQRWVKVFLICLTRGSHWYGDLVWTNFQIWSLCCNVGGHLGFMQIRRTSTHFLT